MAKRKAKTPQQLKKQCLEALQKLVRLKAADDQGFCKCTTCEVIKPWNDGMQGGHFLAKGGSSRWALEEENVHPQCMQCNAFGMNGGAAAVNYTLFMQDTYGRDFVEEMIATKSEAVKFYASDYRDMLLDWNNQIKEHLNRIGK